MEGREKIYAGKKWVNNRENYQKNDQQNYKLHFNAYQNQKLQINA
jgi:hypothetical protein